MHCISYMYIIYTFLNKFQWKVVVLLVDCVCFLIIIDILMDIGASPEPDAPAQCGPILL